MQEYKKILSEFLSIRSISTGQDFKFELNRTVDWLEKLFASNSFTTQVIKGYGNPIVFASLEANPDLDTCLIYGHYDVQPAEKQDGWTSDPFMLDERSGRIFGRGVVDNKGQVLIHILTIAQLAQEKNLGYNIKFIIEGDEETGSGKLGQFISDHKDLLAADFALLSDGEFGDCPIIEAGFRGGFNVTLTLTTSHIDLHSGIYGTGAPNAAHELAKLLTTLYDEQHKVNISGFYEEVDNVAEDIIKMHKNLPFNLETYKKVSGTKALLTEPGYDFYTQTGLRPSVQVTSMQSGYVGEGYRNSIAAKASVKINFRLVKSQNPHKITNLFEKHIQKFLPDHVDYSLEFHDFFEGVKLNLDNNYTHAAVQALSKSHARKPAYKFCGGGIPVVTHFDQLLGLPILSVPLANEDCAIHAVDENFRLDYIDKGAEFSKIFFAKI